MAKRDGVIVLLNGYSQGLLEDQQNPQIRRVRPTQTLMPQYQHNQEFQMLHPQLSLFQVSPKNLHQYLPHLNQDEILFFCQDQH